MSQKGYKIIFIVSSACNVRVISSTTFILWTTLLLLNSMSGIVASYTKFANLNENVSLNCSYKLEVDKMRWSFRKTKNDIWDIFFDARNQPNSEVKCEPNGKYCKIDIFRVTENRAGSYRFEHGSNGQPMTIECTIELIVGELQCQSNIRQTGVLVGENDCPVTPETFTRSCSFSYFGNHDGSLNFLWMKKVSSTVVKDKVIQGSLTTSDEERKVRLVEDLVKVSNDMDKAIFECRLDGEDQIRPCKLPQISVQYGKNTLDEKLQLHSTNPKNLNCSIEKSKNLECSYSWEVFNGIMKHQITLQSLPKEHLPTHCIYKCHASCNFATGESCPFIGQSIDLCQNNSDIGEGWIAFAALSSTIVVCILVLAIIFIIRKRKHQLKAEKGTLMKESVEGKRAQKHCSNPAEVYVRDSTVEARDTDSTLQLLNVKKNKKDILMKESVEEEPTSRVSLFEV